MDTQTTRRLLCFIRTVKGDSKYRRCHIYQSEIRESYTIFSEEIELILSKWNSNIYRVFLHKKINISWKLSSANNGTHNAMLVYLVIELIAHNSSLYKNADFFTAKLLRMMECSSSLLRGKTIRSINMIAGVDGKIMENV